MERRSLPFFFFFWTSVSALLTPKGVNYEALMGIKNSLKDGNHVLYNWDGDAVDPCNWVSVSCSPDRFVNYLLLQDNNISGPIPPELGRLKKLETLDLSDNFFTGHLPHTLSHMKSLHYLRLNNNSLTGTIPSSLANMSQLALLYIGNPEICAIGKEQNCFRTTTQLSSNLNNVSQDSEWSGRRKKQKMGLALGSTLSSICLLILGFAFLLWWRQRYNKQVFFDVNGTYFN
ncbi:protein NSP-INTERACTING KINASE 2 [Senna tora]|uniref:Protein NSP-INTERACTING KINASE 2 n=1 Tax=Senna tora TaxID=362788 RepID=A0A834TSZ8_9FABA|nr:protein NSP-INTERACTING KINASE 2 [Senna tora]